MLKGYKENTSPAVDEATESRIFTLFQGFRILRNCWREEFYILEPKILVSKKFIDHRIHFIRRCK